MKIKIKMYKAIFSIVVGALMPFNSMATLSVSYDQVNYQELPVTVLYPFSYQGLVSVGENNFSSSMSYLPKILPNYWDIIVVGRDILEQECHSDGQLEALDYEKFPHKELLTVSAIQKCGIGFSVLGVTLNYSLLHQYGVPPTHWVDLFDFNRYPGKRALPKQAKYLFEAILLADGVQPDYLYPVLATREGQDRVLNKIDLIYDDILWWNDINNLKLWLEQGLVAISVAPDGAMLAKEGIDTIGVSRYQVLYEMRYYAMLKDSKNKDIAYAFISYATQPEQQLKLTAFQYYGPTIKQATSLINPDFYSYITNTPKNLQHGILIDYDFYAVHGKELQARFDEWLASKEIPVKKVLISTLENSDVKIVPEAQDSTEFLWENTNIEFVGPLPNIIDDDFVGPQPVDYMNENRVFKEK